jgi:hypothetical protein
MEDVVVVVVVVGIGGFKERAFVHGERNSHFPRLRLEFPLSESP